jgi:hypothetical protein
MPRPTYVTTDVYDLHCFGDNQKLG